MITAEALKNVEKSCGVSPTLDGIWVNNQLVAALRLPESLYLDWVHNAGFSTLKLITCSPISLMRTQLRSQPSLKVGFSPRQSSNRASKRPSLLCKASPSPATAAQVQRTCWQYYRLSDVGCWFRVLPLQSRFLHCATSYQPSRSPNMIATTSNGRPPFWMGYLRSGSHRFGWSTVTITRFLNHTGLGTWALNFANSKCSWTHL